MRFIRFLMLAALLFPCVATAQLNTGGTGVITGQVQSPVYNVGQYGILPDGSDQTAKLAALLAKVYAAGGGTIEFGVGTYRFDKRVVIPNTVTVGTDSPGARPKQPAFLFKGQGAWASGSWLRATGDLPNGGTVLDIRAPVISVVDGSFNHTTKVLTKASAFANYTFYAGDHIQITGGTNCNPYYIRIAGKVSDDAITLAVDITSDASDPTNVAATLVQPASIITRGDGYLAMRDLIVFNGGSDSRNFLHTTNTTLNIRDCSFYGYSTRTTPVNNTDDVLILGAAAGQIKVPTDFVWDHTAQTFQSSSLTGYIWRSGDRFKAISDADGAADIVTGFYTIDGKPAADKVHVTVNTPNPSTGVTAISGAIEPQIDDTDLAPFQGYGTLIDGNWFDRVRRAVYGRTYCNLVRFTNNQIWSTSGGLTAVEFRGFYNDSVAGNVITGNTIDMTAYNYGIVLARSYGALIAGNPFSDSETSTPGVPLAYVSFEDGSAGNTLIQAFNAGRDGGSTAIPGFVEDSTSTGLNWVQDPNPVILQNSVLPGKMKWTGGQTFGNTAFANAYGQGPAIEDTAAGRVLAWRTYGTITSNPKLTLQEWNTKPGTITKVDADTGSFTSSGIVGLPVGASVTIAWDGGQRTGMLVTAANSGVVNVDGGTGTDLPTTGTTGTIRRNQQSGVASFGSPGSQRVSLLFEESAILSADIISPANLRLYSSGTDKTIQIGDSGDSVTLGSLNASVAAAGSTQATATAMTATVNVVATATADTADGVALPAAAAGLVVVVRNATAVAVDVFPNNAQNDAIDGGSADAAITQTAGTTIIFIGVNADNWVTLKGS